MQTPHISKVGDHHRRGSRKNVKAKRQEKYFEELSSGLDVAIAHRSSQQNLNKSRWPNSEIDGDSAAL